MFVPQIELPEKLVPVFSGPADTRGAYGGRGSGKTRSFALMSAVRAYMWDLEGRSGQVLCGRQFMNSLADSSFEEVKLSIESEPWLADAFDLGDRYIRSKSGRIYYTFSGLDRNVDSIKSKSRILLAWIDEAEPVTEEAWQKLIPTIREEGSELWVTWNPERRVSATHKRFRETSDPMQKIIELNWRDNPWFPDRLERTRAKDKVERPSQYEHIWEGDFVSVVEGAYFASALQEAKAKGRIGRVGPDPLMTYRAVWDIGGTGAKADACAVWIMQWVGKEIRVLDYYEAVGQPLSTHVNWLREKGYGKALCILPHDGDTHDRVFDVSYASALKEAGFDTQVVPNQGKGAAKMRIEAARRLFPNIWFNESTTEPGRLALGWYHAKKDADRGVDLGPEHDWSSHGADAFGLGCVAYEAPEERKKPQAVRFQPGAWMG